MSDKPCKHCGYCDKCGRSNQVGPVYPYPYRPYPYWVWNPPAVYSTTISTPPKTSTWNVTGTITPNTTNTVTINSADLGGYFGSGSFTS